MWWLTVGCDRPDGSRRSQAQTCPSADAMYDSRRSLVRVGEGGERGGEGLGLVLVERLGADRRAAELGVDRGPGGAGAHA